MTQKTILVVEDQALLLLLSEEVLTEAGYRVLIAADASRAMELSSREPIDLLVTDLSLPGISGRALAERLQASKPALAVLYTSGYPNEPLLAPDAAFLAKPFTPEMLLEAVAGLVA